MDIPRSPGGFDKICFGCNQIKCAQFLGPSFQIPSNIISVAQWIKSRLDYSIDTYSVNKLIEQGVAFHSQYGCQNAIPTPIAPNLDNIKQHIKTKRQEIGSNNLDNILKNQQKVIPTEVATQLPSFGQQIVCVATGIGGLIIGGQVTVSSIRQQIVEINKGNTAKGVTNIVIQSAGTTGGITAGAILGAQYGATIGLVGGPIGSGVGLILGTGVGAITGALTGFGIKKLLPWNW